MTTNALPMSKPRSRSFLAITCFLVVCWPVQGGVSQNPPRPQPGVPAPPQFPGDVTGEAANPLAASNAAKLAHMREDDRRKRLLDDTAKLVELSNELKTDVEKASKDQLSLEVVRKAAEIEKLAHDVKERMKS